MRVIVNTTNGTKERLIPVTGCLRGLRILEVRLSAEDISSMLNLDDNKLRESLIEIVTRFPPNR